MITKEAKKYTDFDAIYTSPFERTKETASIFANASNCTIIEDDRLKEFDVGDLDLKPHEMFNSMMDQKEDPAYIFKNGESLSNVLNRLVDFIHEINSKYTDKKILIVTHGVPAEILIDWTINAPLKKWVKCIEKGEVFKLEMRKLQAKNNLTSASIWDSLSQEYFNNFDDEKIEPEAIENLYFAWPVIKRFIKKNIKNIKAKRALDFGCGTGQVCTELDRLGLITTGVDYSKGMIAVAKKNINTRVNLYLGDSEKVVGVAKKDGKFDLIISILAFPFIEKIGQTIKDLCQSLNKDGYLCFAVFNEKWVHEALKNNIDYEQPQNRKGVKKLIMRLGENRVDIFHRSSNEYDKILAKLDCKKILEEYPLFTKKFITKVYPGMPKHISEYMILGYKK